MQITFKKVHKDAKVPTYAHAGDAGMDLYASETTTVPAGQRGVVPTGIAFAIPNGYVGLLWDKSGIVTKRGITTLAGVIDAGYRGELRVALYNTSDEAQTIAAGEKVVQMLIQPIEHPNLIEVDELDETARGEGGFGSTGVV